MGKAEIHQAVRGLEWHLQHRKREKIWPPGFTELPAKKHSAKITGRAEAKSSAKKGERGKRVREPRVQGTLSKTAKCRRINIFAACSNCGWVRGRKGENHTKLANVIRKKYGKLKKTRTYISCLHTSGESSHNSRLSTGEAHVGPKDRRTNVFFLNLMVESA